jgi:hypothetical protein
MNLGISARSQESVAVAQNATEYSEIFRHDKSSGYSGMLITVSAGSVTVTQQCGLEDNGLFYDPVDASNTALGSVVTTMGAGTRCVQYDPVMAPFVRFKIVEANVASTTVTFTPFFLEDR